MSVLLTIEVAGPDRKARRLVVSAEGWQRLTSAAVVKALELQEGEYAGTSGSLEVLLGEIEYEHAKERAFTLLAYRPRSRAELLKRLRDDGYPAAVSAAAVDRIAELGYVDDRAYAESLVRSKRASGWGERKIRRTLASKGIDADVVEDVFASMDDDEFERASRLVSGRPCTSPKDRDRLVRRLVSRGFSPTVAFSVVGAARDACMDDGHGDLPVGEDPL